MPNEIDPWHDPYGHRDAIRKLEQWRVAFPLGLAAFGIFFAWMWDLLSLDHDPTTTDLLLLMVLMGIFLLNGLIVEVGKMLLQSALLQEQRMHARDQDG